MTQPSKPQFTFRPTPRTIEQIEAEALLTEDPARLETLRDEWRVAKRRREMATPGSYARNRTARAAVRNRSRA